MVKTIGIRVGEKMGLRPQLIPSFPRTILNAFVSKSDRQGSVVVSHLHCQ